MCVCEETRPNQETQNFSKENAGHHGRYASDPQHRLKYVYFACVSLALPVRSRPRRHATCRNTSKKHSKHQIQSRTPRTVSRSFRCFSSPFRFCLLLGGVYDFDNVSTVKNRKGPTKSKRTTRQSGIRQHTPAYASVRLTYADVCP